MLEKIILSDKGSRNHFHDVLFLSKNKHYTLIAAYLPKQNIYVVNIKNKDDVKFIDKYYKLVPVARNPSKKFCKLRRYGRYGYGFIAVGLDLLYITKEELSVLQHKEGVD